MGLKARSTMAGLLAGACFILMPSGYAFSKGLENTLGASLELKKAHVLRFYQRCLSENKSDSVCRFELERLHPREEAALQGILRNATRYDQYEVSAAMASCYGPTRDYGDLVKCWERLSSKMATGEGIKVVNPTTETSSPGVLSDLAGLNAVEKKSIVLCVRGTISVNYRDTVSQNFQSGGDDSAWALKVNALESGQMSDLAKAANWIDMQTYYDAETDATERLIRGELTIDSYKDAARQNSGALKKTLDGEAANMNEHRRNFEKLGPICKTVSTAIIGKAKAAASR
ncbi:hypothetical protein FKO01_21840 [Mesorhizobium sp. B2-3-3]|nr:hypothetical protein FKO01_21840 [Mesorhizobium sp. B2-3-3]